MYLKGAEWARGEPGRTQGWAAVARPSPRPTGAAVGGPEVTTTLASSRAPILRCRCPHPHSAFQLRSTLGGGGPEWGSCLCLAPLPRTLHFDPGWELYDSPPGSASCEGGSWVLGPRGLPWTSPQDPAALTETISHRAQAGTWLGSHSSSRGSGCSPAAKCPCPSPSPQAGVSVRVCSC